MTVTDNHNHIHGHYHIHIHEHHILKYHVLSTQRYFRNEYEGDNTLTQHDAKEEAICH